MSERKELQEALCHYISDTLSYINSVRGFCEKISEWVSMRRTERKMMTHIKNKVDSVDQPEDEVQAFEEYMKSKETELDPDSRPTDLQKELAVVLKDTLRGLEELNCFLDAVEKLAVTSLNVFMENQVLYLNDGIDFEHVQIIITFAQIICPLLLKFKRDAQVFFLPKLQNVEVLSNQLDIYIETTQAICQELGKSFFCDFSVVTTTETQVDLNVDVSEDDIQRMLDHINQLDEIRMNQHSRTVFLFEKESCSTFISEFKERQPRMRQCLKKLEECAVQLDRMNLGSKISSVTGSSVGAIGGVLSIVGLALMQPCGVSLGLAIAGASLGITSGVNSVVTAATEVGVNVTQQYKANEVFKDFMKDVQVLHDCLEEVISQSLSKMEAINVKLGVGKVVGTVVDVGKNFHSLICKASNLKLLQNRGATKGSVALVKSTRVGAFAVNALFIGMDIISICKDSISLGPGSETKISQFIRARSALWSSEIDSWRKSHDSLCEGLQMSEKNEALLETPLYPELDVKKLEEEIEEETAAEEVDKKTPKRTKALLEVTFYSEEEEEKEEIAAEEVDKKTSKRNKALLEVTFSPKEEEEETSAEEVDKKTSKRNKALLEVTFSPKEEEEETSAEEVDKKTPKRNKALLEVTFYAEEEQEETAADEVDENTSNRNEDLSEAPFYPEEEEEEEDTEEETVDVAVKIVINKKCCCCVVQFCCKHCCCCVVQ